MSGMCLDQRSFARGRINPKTQAVLMLTSVMPFPYPSDLDSTGNLMA